MPSHRTTLNTLYLLFFATHPLTVLLVDAYTLYPSSLLTSFPQLSFLTTLHDYYVASYRDRLASIDTRPAWFTLFLWMEVLGHVPVSVWATGRLWRELRTTVPASTYTAATTALPLLLFAFQTFLTTAVCSAEVLSWDTHTSAEKGRLMALYLPYCAFAGVMGWDMFGRVRRALEAGRVGGGVKKVN